MPTVTHRLPGLVFREHHFTVPLNYAAPWDETISVFAREVAAAERDEG